jgi:hypothetical protein
MLITWPSPFVYWTEVKNHKLIKETLSGDIKNHSKDFKYYNSPMKTRKIGDPKWDCEVITTFFDRDDVKDFFTQEIVEQIIGEPLDEMFVDSNFPIKIKPKETILTEIWYNVYKPGYSQEIHAHHGATFSGIYLLELNEPNTTVFFSNTPTYKYNESKSMSSSFSTENIKEGNVILFPSELSHLVKKSEKFRITISFNLICNF